MRASFNCSTWTLDRGAYVAVKRTYQQQLALKKRRLVDSVELLAPLSAENRSTLADALQVAPVRTGWRGKNVQYFTYEKIVVLFGIKNIFLS